MKYLCLAYEEESKLASMPENDWEVLRVETLAYVDELKRNGSLIATEALQTVRNAMTVRVREKKVRATDGPFAETKEQLGGFFLIEAKDMKEAIQVASRWPSACLGSIEVRPIQEELKSGNRYDS